VRTLSDPWRNLAPLTDATAQSLAVQAGRRMANAPPAALLRADRRQWLVTDGVHAALLDWPRGARPDRVIQHASVTRNVGLQRLSARRNATDPAKIDLLLDVANGGDAAETREVVFVTDDREVARSTVHVDPGKSEFVDATIESAARISASLQPGDALPDDDTITLELAPLRRVPVAVDAGCPAALRAAITAHPSLARAEGGVAAAALDCGALVPPEPVPTIRVIADQPPSRPRGPVLWSSSVAESERIRIDPERLVVAARLRPSATDRVLLAVGAEPIVVERSGAAPLIETSIDFRSPQVSRSPELPLLVDWMAGRALGTRLLDRIAVADRGPNSATVAPWRRIATGGARPADDSGHRRERAKPLLFAAMLVVVWELVALARQWIAARPLVEGPAR
jgi:hypothetical protein